MQVGRIRHPQARVDRHRAPLDAAVRARQLFARVDNLFNRRFANFAILGDNVFTGPAQRFDAANPRAEQFRGYGAPRGAEIGMEYRFE